MTIRLQVTGDDAPRQSLERCLAEELRKDPTLRVGDAPAALTFDVIVTSQKMSDGSVLGFLLYLGGYVPAAQSSDQPDPSAGVLILWQKLRMAPPDLEAACRRAVTEYRSEVVGPLRRDIKQFKKSLPVQPPP